MVTATRTSQRVVFRHIAQRPYCDWPNYDSTPLYDRSSLAAVEEDVQMVASVWFEHDAHESVDEFACRLPLVYLDFTTHDCYSSTTRYEMKQLFRVFLLKELHGWTHETALVEYLQQSPKISEQLGFDTIPDQSTLWRTWNQRFTEDLRNTIQAAAQTILLKATDYDVTIPREPNRAFQESDEEPFLDDQTILNRSEEITTSVSRDIYPAFSLDRRNPRDVPYGDSSHSQPTSESDSFHRTGIVAIDTTEANPFTGDRTGHEDEIIGTKENTDEYAYQWATIQLVGNAVPLILDARPVRKGDSRLEIVEDLLDSAKDLIHVDNVLMDREFDSQHILEEISQRGLSYVVPKRMHTSEKAQAKRLLKRDVDRYETERKLHLGHNEWHETMLIYRRKGDSEHTDYQQYSVFMSNRGGRFLEEYGYRWEIESGYKSVKRFMAATTSKNFVLRFFYFAFACLLYSIWRAVDLLVQVDLTGEYERSPMVTADNTLTLLKKQTGIG